ncbi:maleylpyruvate isomerase family mycothiol-dependent enzyme [Plantactinospora sp. BB1]|uniref:maleylpyruvate isomerase family mycothiol-dependent enzyme n=1 Tax=Plantactinospora sp. BB1 TaxID=2071627 RepID=UPI000D16560C|nr:maleylpyruvate isomerase family mycothiol-dependent enzyme [Plantactinospora sp. BB1]AVT39972.1 maleylpyruvate isomerase family mycothiol-dependent enzyme [Plantactinospora sp. BB1]
MDPEKIFEWTVAERLSLADFLDGLDEHEWQVASLCPGWTVQDVLAHLTLGTRTTVRDLLVGLIRSGGGFNRMEARMARDRAARFSPAELVAQFRSSAASRRRSPGSGPLDPLVDALVHGQDIARPLGRIRKMPPEPALAGLEYARKSSFYGARRRFRGIRLVATDLEWSAGDGPDEVRGPVADLLMLATGRSAGLATLSGPGAERLAGTR